MAAPSYEDISPAEEEEVTGTLPLLSEQELRRVLEELQGEGSGLELWTGQGSGGSGGSAGEGEHSQERGEVTKHTFGDSSKETVGESSQDTVAEATKDTGGEGSQDTASGGGEVSQQTAGQTSSTLEPEKSKFEGFRERVEVTTEEESMTEEEEDVGARPVEAGSNLGGLLLFSTMGVGLRGGERMEEGEASGSKPRPQATRKKKMTKRRGREPGDVLKRGDLLEYLVEDGDEETWFKVEVMGKGKARGKNKNYINLR